MGKSLYIQRMAEDLKRNTGGNVHIFIPLHGPNVAPDTVLEFLNEYTKNSDSAIFHLDIAPIVHSMLLNLQVRCNITNMFFIPV